MERHSLHRRLDAEQFDRLIRQYGPPLECYLMQYGRVPPDQAEDLVHEFLIAKLLKPAPQDNLVSCFCKVSKSYPIAGFEITCDDHC